MKNACKRFVMELKPTFISDDNPNKDINVAFYNIPIVKRCVNFPFQFLFFQFNNF